MARPVNLPKGPNGKPLPGPGRPKGSRPADKVEAEAAARAIVDDPTYRANLAKRVKDGNVAPAVETMLWHYAHGKPVERHEVKHTGYEDTPNSELAKLAREAAELLEKLP